MFYDENFEDIGFSGMGNLILKLPGINIVLPFDGGYAYVNEPGNVGYLNLFVNGIEAVKTSGENGIMGVEGEELRRRLENPEIKGRMMGEIDEKGINIFLSPTPKGGRVITLPGTPSEGLNTLSGVIGDALVSSYNSMNPLALEEVYDLHLLMVGGNSIEDRRRLVKEVPELVGTANILYTNNLRRILALGFP